MFLLTTSTAVHSLLSRALDELGLEAGQLYAIYTQLEGEQMEVVAVVDDDGSRECDTGSSETSTDTR